MYKQKYVIPQNRHSNQKVIAARFEVAFGGKVGGRKLFTAFYKHATAFYKTFYSFTKLLQTFTALLRIQNTISFPIYMSQTPTKYCLDRSHRGEMYINIV